MKKESNNYKRYFTPGQQAKALIKLTESKFIDRNGEITSVDDDLIRLEILGDAVPVQDLSGNRGARVNISVSSGWGLYRCNGTLEEVIGSKEIIVRLSGGVEETQSREYFRLDVHVPLFYEIPDEQHFVSITEGWNEKRKKFLSAEPVLFPHDKGYKVVKWLGGDDLLPVGVNLSGGGVRLKTYNQLQAGTSALMDIFLPLAPPRVITTVAEVVRCKEIQLSWEKGTSYMTAMKFVKIDEKDREAIISFLFSEQRNKLLENRERKA